MEAVVQKYGKIPREILENLASTSNVMTAYLCKDSGHSGRVRTESLDESVRSKKRDDHVVKVFKMLIYLRQFSKENKELVEKSKSAEKKSWKNQIIFDLDPVTNRPWIAFISTVLTRHADRFNPDEMMRKMFAKGQTPFTKRHTASDIAKELDKIGFMDVRMDRDAITLDELKRMRIAELRGVKFSVVSKSK